VRFDTTDSITNDKSLKCRGEEMKGKGGEEEREDDRMNDDEEEHDTGDDDDNNEIHYEDRGRSSGDEEIGSQDHYRK
jgi:hypothetical protein